MASLFCVKNSQSGTPMCFIPPLILCDGAFFQLSSDRGKHFTGIIGKVKVSHFSRGDRHNGKSFFVLFQ